MATKIEDVFYVDGNGTSCKLQFSAFSECDGAYTSAKHDDESYCCRTEMSYYVNGDMTPIHGFGMVVKLPQCIEFDIGRKLTDSGEPVHHDESYDGEIRNRGEECYDETIGVSCSLCEMVFIGNACENNDRFAPVEHVEALKYILAHVETHKNKRKAMELRAVLDDEKPEFADLESDGSGENFRCLHHKTCKFGWCAEKASKYRMRMYGANMDAETAMEHHKWFVRKMELQRNAITMMLGCTAGAGMDSPICLIDAQLAQNIFSLVKSC